MAYSSSSDSDSRDFGYDDTSFSISASRTQQQEPVILSRLPPGAIPISSNPPDCAPCQGKPQRRRERSSRPQPSRRPRYRDDEEDDRGRIPAKEIFRIHLESAYDIFTPNSKNAPRVRFTFVRTPENVVFMQWEEFSFTVGATGIAGVNLNQEYDALPPGLLTLECPIIYRGVRRQTTLSIDPQSGQPFRFNFFYDGSAEQVAEKDRVTIPASCVSWITEQK